MSESAMSGFYSPGSVTWRIHSDTSMFVGGIRALLEQALHPEAMAGVAAHSNFREDAWGRLQRTGDYVGTLTFGTRDEAEKLAARVRKVHAMLKLDDQKLLLWVHMAMVDSFLDTALRSGLVLSEQEQDAYIDEMLTFALLVGIEESRVPRNRAELLSISGKYHLNYRQVMMPNVLRYSSHSHLCRHYFDLELPLLLCGVESHLSRERRCHDGRDLYMVGRLFQVMNELRILRSRQRATPSNFYRNHSARAHR